MNAWRRELLAISDLGAPTVARQWATGKTVNVEYVSANPTGPMHMGHCRGAVVGDALASLLEWAGHRVTREYYVNDAGGQVDVLARSRTCATARRWARISAPFPKASIPATISSPWASGWRRNSATAYKDAESEWLGLFRAARSPR